MSINAANLINLASIPLMTANQSVTRITNAYDANQATSGTLLLATAPALLSTISVATGHYAGATTALSNYALSLADRAIAGRGLDIANMTAGQMLSNSLDIAQQVSLSGIFGPQASQIVSAARQLQSTVTTTYNAWQRLGAAQNRLQAVTNSNALPLPGGQTNPAAGPNLLVLSVDNQKYYFNLSTTAHDKLTREAQYNIPVLERLGRRPALQAVGLGAESITLSGVVFAEFKNAGVNQIEKLRTIAKLLKPVDLVTGYGQVLGKWYLMRISEEQEALLSNGLPRKQTYSIEFGHYGDDYQNV